MRANDLKEIWNIFRHYNLKQISYFTTLISVLWLIRYATLYKITKNQGIDLI